MSGGAEVPGNPAAGGEKIVSASRHSRSTRDSSDSNDELTGEFDPSFAAAWAELGYADQEQGPRRLMTSREAEAWAQAVLRLRARSGFTDRTGEIPALVQTIASKLERLVGQTLRDGGDEQPGLDLVATLLEADADDGGLTTTVAVAILMRWLAAARESGRVDPGAIVDWVDRSFGRLPAGAAKSAAGILGHPMATESVAEAHARLDPMFAPALIWLTAGAVATAGNGDVHWLRQFDPSPGRDALSADGGAPRAD